MVKGETVVPICDREQASGAKVSGEMRTVAAAAEAALGEVKVPRVVVAMATEEAATAMAEVAGRQRGRSVRLARMQTPRT